jgi:hypothetical protein
VRSWCDWRSNTEWLCASPIQRVGKCALIQHQRYAHAKQFKRAIRMLKKLRTLLGRVIRDITRKMEGDSGLEAVFAQLLMLARRVREQQQRQRGPKVYPCCTRRKSNASARVKPIGLTSSASRYPSPLPSAAPRAANSSLT